MIPRIQELPSFRLFQALSDSFRLFQTLSDSFMIFETEILYAKGYLFEDPKPWNTSHTPLRKFLEVLQFFPWIEYHFPWIEYQKRDRDTSSCCCKRNAKSSRSCSLSSYHQVVFQQTIYSGSLMFIGHHRK